MTNAVDEKGRGSIDAAANAAEEILAHSEGVAVFHKILRKRLELYPFLGSREQHLTSLVRGGSATLQARA